MRSPTLVPAALAALLALQSCGGQRPGVDTLPLPIGRIEALYQETRALGDAIDVTRSRGAQATPEGTSLRSLAVRYAEACDELRRILAAGAAPPLSDEDARALEVMRRALARELGEVELEEASPDGADAPGAPACDYDPEEVAAGPGGAEALSERIYACFAAAAGSLAFEGQATDRLTLMGQLALTPEASRREALWRALEPVWEAINGDNGPGAPYRTLIRAHAALLEARGEALGGAARGIGVEPGLMEDWLIQVLERWRDLAPRAAIDPWDYAYRAGEAQRALDGAIALASLRPLNDRFYADLGADPVALGVQYDLEPRPGKDPVAFTTFGRRPRLEGDRAIPGEPWVFASYRIGGLDNLLELLHETGHAIHIAAIRTRPAFADWPDSDIFTEALADVAALEIYEPTWQERYLGTSAPIATTLRAKYAGIVMDVAWALFEVRMARQPERDPNRVWSEIAETWLRIAPHPEVSWWAVRGQLVDAPGYMMNYAAGAILIADLRRRLRELHGPFAEGDPGWYARVAPSLYRFGLERPSQQVIEDFLGRPVSPQALLDDLARALAPTGDRAGSSPPTSSRGAALRPAAGAG